ncbi:hypothetical protein EYC80_001256 [Monilinia laxa]|uniref:Uncharacterized protein n=1 Tax=Monilinia laxa TaxID=61186 RepID=A0A5N6K8N1_MONLA|nr:hypothetical protein EYC80_001256 [Monilinia laxa]
MIREIRKYSASCVLYIYDNDMNSSSPGPIFSCFRSPVHHFYIRRHISSSQKDRKDYIRKPRQAYHQTPFPIRLS